MANFPAYIRSPFLVSIEGVVNDTTEVRLFIWNSPDSEPVAPTHSLTLTIPSSTTRVWFDISPYIREFVAMQSFTEVTTPTAAPVAEYCYCHVIRYLNGSPLVKEEDLICMEGYGYHSEEFNPQSDTMLAQGDYYVQAASTSGALGIFQNLVDTWQVRYTGLSSGDTTALTISNEFSYTPYLLPAYVNEGNKVEILVNSVVTFTYNFILQDECKYTPLNCDFVNKQGAWERLVFFKKSSSDISMTNEEFNLMPANPDYNVLDNVRNTFNTNAMETITCNTGWVFEHYKDVLKQLQLSEKILLDNVPVIIKSKGVKLQKSINDKNINYEVTFQYSAPVLQYNI